MENQFLSALKLCKFKSALCLISELISSGVTRSGLFMLRKNCKIHVRNQLLLAEYKCLPDDWPSCSGFKTWQTASRRTYWVYFRYAISSLPHSSSTLSEIIRLCTWQKKCFQVWNTTAHLDGTLWQMKIPVR